MGNIRLLTIKHLLRCTHAKYPLGTTFLHINRSIACLSPQVYGKALIMQHHPYSTHDRSILSLRDPILLWVMRHYEFSSNSFFVVEFLEFVKDVLSTIIAPKSLHLITRLFLHQCLKITELRDCLIFLLHEEDPTLTRKFIKKYYIVLMFFC